MRKPMYKTDLISLSILVLMLIFANGHILYSTWLFVDVMAAELARRNYCSHARFTAGVCALLNKEQLQMENGNMYTVGMWPLAEV